MKNSISSALSQIYEKHLHNGRIALYTKVNSFKCGELDLRDSTFYSVHRSSKNIMRMFSGLGINEHILTHYSFAYIVIPFNNCELKTTRKKWLQLGVASPFCNIRVDKQIILKLDHINLSEGVFNQIRRSESQLSLFGVAS